MPLFQWLRQQIVGLTDSELVRKGKCPDCKSGQLLQGPQGGACMNVLCDSCLHEFNIFLWHLCENKIEDRRGLVSKERARFFGVDEEEYDAKVNKQEASVNS